MAENHTSQRKWYEYEPTIIEWAVIVAIVLVVIALVLPPRRPHRGGEFRSSCRNNLKAIGLALHNYHDVYSSFPPAYIADEHGKPMHSWRVLILPYLDQQTLYDEYRFDEPWNGPHNITLQDRVPSIYHCPMRQQNREDFAPESESDRRLTNYLMIESTNGVFDGAHAPSLSEITDGTDQTIVAVEAHNHAVHWMRPDDITPDEFLSELKASADEETAIHHGGVLVLMASGRVTSIRSDVPVETINALITKAGDETVDDF